MTSRAVKSAPLVNFTPGRSLNSQVESSTARQDAARRGKGLPSASAETSDSKIWRRRPLFWPTLWKCGSTDVASEATAILRSCADAMATDAMMDATRAARVMPVRFKFIDQSSTPSAAATADGLVLEDS